MAEQTERAAAHALRLELDSLKESQDNGAPLVVSAAEKNWQDALVRLGTAEQKALQAQQELKGQQGAQSALMSEIEAVSQT